MSEHAHVGVFCTCQVSRFAHETHILLSPQASRGHEMSISQTVTLSEEIKSVASHVLMNCGMLFQPSVTVLTTALSGEAVIVLTVKEAIVISIACDGSSVAQGCSLVNHDFYSQSA